MEMQKESFVQKAKLHQRSKEEEIKEWIKIGRKAQVIPEKKFDTSNMAALINYLNFIGLVNDIEKKHIQDLYEKR